MTFHRTGGNMTGAASAKPDITLNDYIARKQDKPKLTFEQWFTNRFSNPDDMCYDWCKEAWFAARENT